MSSGLQIPLGQRIPASLHAVSVSLPTFDDVIGYEEKRPETMAKLETGYPRFLAHTYLRRIEAHWQDLFGAPNQPIWLAASERMAKQLQERLSPAPTKYLRHRGVSGLRLPADPEIVLAGRRFLQRVGGFLSSRQAEDYLLAEGLIAELYPEIPYEGDATVKATSCLEGIMGLPATSMALTNTGMNAFFAAFQAVNRVQLPRGRHSWIKLGWLYVDTMGILDQLSPPEARNEALLDIFDLDALETLLQRRGHEIAGIVTEAPTNPLIQTMDLARVQELARRHGVYLVVDPTVCSPANVDVVPYADIVVNSLTKYAAHEGDVIMGLVAATEHCLEREAIIEALRDEAEAPYPRDLSRLAAQIDGYLPTLATINANTAQVAAFLQSHPKVKKVYWANESRSAANFLRLAKRPDAGGGLLSFEVDGSIADCYDRAPLPKGPSFGIAHSLLCPYIYLAHYDLVTSDEGRRYLSSAGISPELLRLSIGTEPAEQLIAALAEALG